MRFSDTRKKSKWSTTKGAIRTLFLGGLNCYNISYELHKLHYIQQLSELQTKLDSRWAKPIQALPPICAYVYHPQLLSLFFFRVFIDFLKCFYIGRRL